MRMPQGAIGDGESINQRYRRTAYAHTNTPKKCRKICEQCLITLRNVLNCYVVQYNDGRTINEKAHIHTSYKHINSPQSIQTFANNMKLAWLGTFVTSRHRRHRHRHVLFVDARSLAHIFATPKCE